MRRLLRRLLLWSKHLPRLGLNDKSQVVVDAEIGYMKDDTIVAKRAIHSFLGRCSSL